MLSKLCDDLRWIAEFQDIPYYREIILDAVDTIETLSADRPTGKWIKSYLTERCGTDENHDAVFRKVPCVRCDQCGEKRRHEEKFCPNCGAEMEV